MGDEGRRVALVTAVTENVILSVSDEVIEVVAVGEAKGTRESDSVGVEGGIAVVSRCLSEQGEDR